MKHMMKLILALILATACVCAALAEEEPDYRDMYPESLAYESDWGCGGTMLQIWCEDGGFRVMVTQRAGDMLDERLVWEYSPFYDAESQTLISLFAVKTREYCGDGGELIGSETLYEDGSATFSLLENGNLVWNDEVEDAGKGMEFMKLGRFQGNYVCGRCQIEILWEADDVYAIGAAALSRAPIGR